MKSRSPGCFLQNRDGVEPPSGWRARRVWIVSRSLCGFRLFRVPEAGRTNLRDFAALKAREWAPYSEVGFHAHVTDDAVRIWAWDGARVADAMSAAGISRSRTAVLPETALRDRLDDGLHLVRCTDGFEGQFWSGGELNASRWWPQAPSREQWVEFQRATGMPPSTESPPVEDPEWRSRRWTNSGEGLGYGVERHSRELALAGVAVLLAGYGYFGAALAHHSLQLSDIQDRLQQAEQQAGPVLADRERALANLKFLNDFAKLNPYPSQLMLFAKVAEKLPLNGARITAWSYEQGELQFTVLSPSAVDILFYVKAYSAVDGFTDVTANTAENDQTLRVKLRVAKS